jgi:hypothetical protein
MVLTITIKKRGIVDYINRRNQGTIKQKRIKSEIRNRLEFI